MAGSNAKNHLILMKLGIRGYSKLLIMNLRCAFESKISPIVLKLRIRTYFDLLITNITMKIGANDTLKVKTKKKNLIFHVFHITSIHIRFREKRCRQKL